MVSHVEYIYGSWLNGIKGIHHTSLTLQKNKISCAFFSIGIKRVRCPFVLTCPKGSLLGSSQQHPTGRGTATLKGVGGPVPQLPSRVGWAGEKAVR